MYYYDSGLNYSFTGGYTLLPPAKNQQPQVVTEPQNLENIKKTSDNNTLLWGGLTGLAILGTYLITRGHYKGRISAGVSNPAAATQATEQVAHATAQAAKPIPEAASTFANSYKPFSGIQGVAGEIKPTLTQVGSRTRADFDAIVNGQQIRETLIFNAEGKPVSRFVQTTDKDGKVVREAFKINDKGEISEAVQRSTRSTTAADLKKNTKRIVHKNIENLTVNEPPKDLPNGRDIDAASNIRTLTFSRYYDDKTGRLIRTTAERDYINPKGEGIYACFKNEKTFGYDANGNLAAIVEQNPDKLFNNCCYVYRNVADGTSKPLDSAEVNRLLKSADNIKNPLVSAERDLFRNWRYSGYNPEVRQYIETIRPKGFENVTPQIRYSPNGTGNPNDIQLRYATEVNGKPRKIVIEFKDGKPYMQYELADGHYIERSLQNGWERIDGPQPFEWVSKPELNPMYKL